MSSLAQEEARSISENTTWGIRKAFSGGVASIPYSHFLGYDKGENSEFVINEKEAETVRDIFRLFISGYSFRTICKKLEEKGAKSPTRKDKWYPSTVESIIRNLMLAIWIQSGDSINVENAGKSSVSAAFGSGEVQSWGI